MDNWNDLQWRPEDWQHTLGHLRRAERLLALKTWGLGTAVVGTVATGTALYLQPEEPTEGPAVATVEQVESPVHAAGTIEEMESLTWDEALSSQGGQGTEGFEAASVEAPLISGSTSPMGKVSEDEPSTVQSDEGLPVRAEESQPQGADQAVRTFAQAQAQAQAQAHVQAAANANVPLQEEAVPPANLRLLKSRDGLLLSESPDAVFSGQPRTGTVSLPPRALHVPARLSVLPVQRGVLVESPHTVAHAGPVRIELTPGLALVTEEAQWSAWHPAPVYGNPDVLRRVTSDLAIQSQLALSAMVPLGHLIELGVTAGLKYELTRRLDHGVWNPDANAWDEVYELETWGRVEEASPWSALFGLRLDYAVAPEWKVVTQVGWNIQDDLQHKQPDIEVSPRSAFWLQIGIQR